MARATELGSRDHVLVAMRQGLEPALAFHVPRAPAAQTGPRVSANVGRWVELPLTHNVGPSKRRKRAAKMSHALPPQHFPRKRRRVNEGLTYPSPTVLSGTQSSLSPPTFSSSSSRATHGWSSHGRSSYVKRSPILAYPSLERAELATAELCLLCRSLSAAA